MIGIIHNCYKCNKDFLINRELIIRNRNKYTLDKEQKWYCFNCYLEDRSRGILDNLRDYQLIEMLDKYPDLSDEIKKKAELLLVVKSI
jgi:hypothetical protein